MIDKLKASSAALFVISMVVLALLVTPATIIGMNYLVYKATDVRMLDITLHSIFLLVLVGIVNTLIMIIVDLVKSVLVSLANNLPIVLGVIAICVAYIVRYIMAFYVLRFCFTLFNIAFTNNWAIIIVLIMLVLFESNKSSDNSKKNDYNYSSYY